MKWIPVAVLTAFAVPGILLLSLSHLQARISLTTKARGVYLAENGRRLLLVEDGAWAPNMPPRHIALSSTDSLLLPEFLDQDGAMVVRRGLLPTVTMRYDDIITNWLADESRWRSHQEVNQLRYMQKGAGGIAGRITHVIPTGTGALALFSWYFMGPSGEPMAEQFLVHIRVRPDVRLLPVRRLGKILYYGWHSLPPATLFSAGKRIFLYSLPAPAGDGNIPAGARGTLELLAAGGSSRGIFTRLPASLLPQGVVNGRWVIFASKPDSAGHALQALNLTSKRLMGIGKGLRDTTSSDNYYFSQVGNRFLFMDVNARKPVTRIITLPGGKMVAIPKPRGSISCALWRNYAVVYLNTDGQHYTLTVYNATTGRKVLQATRHM